MIVNEKEYITPEIAKELATRLKDPEVMVRGYVLDDFEYFDGYQERVLTIAEANVDLDVY